MVVVGSSQDAQLMDAPVDGRRSMDGPYPLVVSILSGQGTLTAWLLAYLPA